MRVVLPTLLLYLLFMPEAARPATGPEQTAVALPAGVNAVWDIELAQHESTATRERVCINGLWRWQPAGPDAREVPAKNWGYFKVPGCWPGITDYEQKDCQTLFAHPSWKGDSLNSLTTAWYQREVAIPSRWVGRRISLSIEYLDSFAAVYVDGKQAGEARFPGGEVDLSSACRPGGKYLLSLLVVAMPLDGVLLSYHDTNSARKVRGTVNRRGLCGDLFLVSALAGPRISDVKVRTSTRRGEITIDTKLTGLAANGRYSINAKISEGRHMIYGMQWPIEKMSELTDGRFVFTQPFKPEKLWDLDTPQNMLELSVSLQDSDSRPIDTAEPVRFGFREFWIDGRDFFLNGTRIYLSAVPLDNAQIGAAWATYQAARESLERLKSFGINFVYTHNYGCEPGSHLSFAEILRAADDVGILVSVSQPHFSHYDWHKADADRNNGYARHAEFYVRAAQNHPAVIAYAMSHNATGYDEDMNPDLIDGLQDPRDQWSRNNAELALRAEAIVKRFDPGRIVYHHSSGNLGSMHTSNFYPNFAPVQELCDWFEHWATKGVKPMFTCEYGAPFSWDWGMYRGWYKGQREWGSAKVPWDFCLAEWNAQFLGDRAYQITDNEKANLRWEAKQFLTGDGWHRWDYPHSFSSRDLDEQYPVFALYLTDAWRAFRGWGVSAISPWEHELFWKPRPGLDRHRVELDVDWNHLQRPGFSPDYLDQRYERFDLAFERSDWVPTAAAQALLRNNLPLLGFIGGKSSSFTSKDHNFLPGETVEKQMIVVNNSRRTVNCDCDWSLSLPKAMVGRQRVSLPTGQQQRIPVRFVLPDTLPPGKHELRATFVFDGGPTQDDRFTIDVLPPAPVSRPTAKIALFDPKGETAALLRQLEFRFDPVSAGSDLSAFDVLIVGKAALTVSNAAPRITGIRDGLRVLMFEQTAEALERRLGFRVQEYGLRSVFPRIPDHPLLAGIGTEQLHDWRGESTLLPPRLKYELRPRYGPTVSWCGLTVPRVWRCGNKGSVASVLIEKPMRGDFLPIVDGGYSLQYSPLLEYREGRGMILFCQLDVTGRSDSDPTAEALVRNLLQYVSAWKPVIHRQAEFVGDPTGRKFFESLGVSALPYNGGALHANQVLIVGPGGGKTLAANAVAVADWRKAGGNLVAFGLDQQDMDALPGRKVRVHHQEHIAAYFSPSGVKSLFAGIGPADVHNRDPRELPLVAEGAALVGDGVLAQAESANIVFCQAAPWEFNGDQFNVKKTRRRLSFLASRLLANVGVAGSTPLVERFQAAVADNKPEQRWLDGLYIDRPEEWDDPYRFFRW